jgi:hypothetical protein
LEGSQSLKLCSEDGHHTASRIRAIRDFNDGYGAKQQDKSKAEEKKNANNRDTSGFGKC